MQSIRIIIPDYPKNPKVKKLVFFLILSSSLNHRARLYPIKSDFSNFPPKEIETLYYYYI